MSPAANAKNPNNHQSPTASGSNDSSTLSAIPPAQTANNPNNPSSTLNPSASSPGDQVMSVRDTSTSSSSSRLAHDHLISPTFAILAAPPSHPISRDQTTHTHDPSAKNTESDPLTTGGTTAPIGGTPLETEPEPQPAINDEIDQDYEIPIPRQMRTKSPEGGGGSLSRDHSSSSSGAPGAMGDMGAGGRERRQRDLRELEEREKRIYELHRAKEAQILQNAINHKIENKQKRERLQSPLVYIYVLYICISFSVMYLHARL